MVDTKKIEQLTIELLGTLGEDINRDGLQDTPKRVAKWWQEFIDYKPGNTDTTFEVIKTDQMVVVTGIKVWSLCEHHLLPFWCDISIGYITFNQVLGLSKFGRIAHKYAHRLQIQERLVHQIADEISELCGSPNVAVIGKGEHLCMTMRGIKTPAQMVSSVVRGVFMDTPEARAEFFEMIKLSQ